MVSLDKGDKVTLSKGNSIKEVVVELGWTAQSKPGQPEFDLDASLIALGVDGNLAGGNTDNFVFYNHQRTKDGSIESLSGDNLTGDSKGGVCETLLIRLDKLNRNSEINSVVAVVTIHDYLNRKQNFGQVKSSFVQIRNQDTNEILVRYEPSEDFSATAAVIMARIFRNGNDWKIEAIGEGTDGGLAGICRHFNIPV